MKDKNYQDECNLEGDRKRIAADLHDDFGSLLTGLKLSLMDFDETQPTNTQLENSAVLIDQSLIRLREISLNLVPRELEKEGLNAAIEALVERINEIGSLQIHYSALFEDDQFDTERAMLVFRVIQELTTNAIKHSCASSIELGVVNRANRLIIEIRDNGNGFDYGTAVQKKKSSGLKNIQSRLDLLSAVLMVQSEAGKGTHYFINIPLRQLINGNKLQNKNHPGGRSRSIS